MEQFGYLAHYYVAYIYILSNNSITVTNKAIWICNTVQGNIFRTDIDELSFNPKNQQEKYWTWISFLFR